MKTQLFIAFVMLFIIAISCKLTSYRTTTVNIGTTVFHQDTIGIHELDSTYTNQAHTKYVEQPIPADPVANWIIILTTLVIILEIIILLR